MKIISLISRHSSLLFDLLAFIPFSMCTPAAYGQEEDGVTNKTSLFAADEPAWVVSLAGGLVKGPSSLPLHENLGGARAIALDGSIELDRGQAISFSLARQFWGPESEDGERRYPFRLELEGLRAYLQRKNLMLGVSQVDLSDQIDVEGLFANFLLRVVKTDHLQGWVGTGVGRIRESIHDESAVIPGCACLAAAESDDTVWRVKLRLEWIPDDEQDTDWALFLEGGYSRLPSLLSSSENFPRSTYDKWDIWTLTAGLRLRF